MGEAISLAGFALKPVPCYEKVKISFHNRQGIRQPTDNLHQSGLQIMPVKMESWKMVIMLGSAEKPSSI
jgi:hypothetical protein